MRHGADGACHPVLCLTRWNTAPAGRGGGECDLPPTVLPAGSSGERAPEGQGASAMAGGRASVGSRASMPEGTQSPAAIFPGPGGARCPLKARCSLKARCPLKAGRAHSFARACARAWAGVSAYAKASPGAVGQGATPTPAGGLRKYAWNKYTIQTCQRRRL